MHISEKDPDWTIRLESDSGNCTCIPRAFVHNCDSLVFFPMCKIALCIYRSLYLHKKKNSRYSWHLYSNNFYILLPHSIKPKRPGAIILPKLQMRKLTSKENRAAQLGSERSRVGGGICSQTWRTVGMRRRMLRWAKPLPSTSGPHHLFPLLGIPTHSTCPL